MHMLYRRQTNYERSNAITTVSLAMSDEMKQLAQRILQSSEAAPRQELSESLLDALCDAARIDICQLAVTDTRQRHQRRNGRMVYKLYGCYRPQTNSISIQNRTAVRGKILASKTFLDTLLHEWLHHYDSHVLKIRSIHTSGFYARLQSLKQLLGLRPTE